MSDEITVQELKKLFDNKEEFVLIDVREPHEQEISKINGSKLFPMSEIKKGNFEELETYKDTLIVLHCRSGVRSLNILQFLKLKGYTNLKSLKGGINTWARDIDTSIKIY